MVCMVKEGEKSEKEQFTNKLRRTRGEKEILSQRADQNILLYTDVPALGDREPKGAGAVAHIDLTFPLWLKKGINRISNNYPGELIGIQIN